MGQCTDLNGTARQIREARRQLDELRSALGGSTDAHNVLPVLERACKALEVHFEASQWAALTSRRAQMSMSRAEAVAQHAAAVLMR